MVFLLSYALHLIISFLFFLLIPLPFLIKGTVKEKDLFTKVLRFYQRVISFAHGGLILGLITGVFMTSTWLSYWFFLVIAIWIALGALLGLTAKMNRLTLEGLDKQEMLDEKIEKLRRFSLLLTIAILLMFAVKILRYV